MCTIRVPGACRGQERILNPPWNKIYGWLRAIWILGTKPRSSEKAMSALNPCLPRSPLGIHLKPNQAGSEFTMKPKTTMNSWLSCLYLPSARPACQFRLLSCLFEKFPLLLSQIWPASFDWLLSRFIVSVSYLGSPARERSSHTILPLFLRMHACLMTFRSRTSDSQNFTPENSLRARFKVHFSPKRQLRYSDKFGLRFLSL